FLAPCFPFLEVLSLTTLSRGQSGARIPVFRSSFAWPTSGLSSPRPLALQRLAGIPRVEFGERRVMTVGFISVMILSVGQRILPAFAGMRMLWSTKLMFAGLAFVILGC